MFFFKSLVLMKIQTFALMCSDFRCWDYFIGDSSCDQGCNNQYCNFDSPSNSLSLQISFQSSDCYNSCKTTGCDLSLLGDKSCDSLCNNFECGFDLGDCGVCAPGCTAEMLSNEECDEPCNTNYCKFDMWFCGIVCGKTCTKLMIIKNPGVCLKECMSYDCNIFQNYCYQTCAKDCTISLINNSKCELKCLNKECNYDGDDCSCSPGCNMEVLKEETCRGKDDPCNTKACKFKNKKCGECSSGCFWKMVGDGHCDIECDNADCLFDLKDCGCAPGCSLIYQENNWKNIEFNENNEKCLVPSCFYNIFNNIDSVLLKKVILSQITYGNFKNTSYIHEECENFNEFNDENFGKLCSVHDQCFNEINLWCMGRSELLDEDCLRFGKNQCLVAEGVFVLDRNFKMISECPEKFEEIEKISLLFSGSGKVKWCLPAMENYNTSGIHIYHVRASDVPQSKGVGSSDDPFLSLYYCFTQLFSLKPAIILSEGSHIYQKDDTLPTYLRNDPEDPLNYNNGDSLLFLSLQGINPSSPSKVYWTKSLKISSSFLKISIKNIEFYGDLIIRSDCDGTKEICYYCPYFNPNTNQNDKGEEVSQEDKSFYLNDCSEFKSNELFVFKGEAILENLKFFNFRQQFKNLIVGKSSLNLTNVEFGKIQSTNGGHVLLVSCEENCGSVNLTMKNIYVHEMNLGYEFSYFLVTGNFLKVENIYSVFIESFRSYLNVIKCDDFCYFFYEKSCNGTFGLVNSKFDTLLMGSLLVVDNSDITSYIDLQLDDYTNSISHSYTHLLLNNLTFIEVYTSGDFIKFTSGMIQNIDIKKISLQNVASKQRFFSFKSVSKYFDPGPLVSDSGANYYIRTVFANIQDIIIEDSSVDSSSIEISLFPNISLTNIIISGIIDRIDGYHALQIYYKFSDFSYFSDPFPGYLIFKTICESFIFASDSTNIILNNISISECECLYSSGYQGIVLNSIRFILMTSISLKDIQVQDTSKVILNIKGSNNVKTEFQASNLINYSGSLINFEKIITLELFNIFLSDSNSSDSSAIIFSDIYSLKIKGAFFNTIETSLGKVAVIEYYISANTGINKIEIENMEFRTFIGGMLSSLMIFNSRILIEVNLSIKNLQVVNTISQNNDLIIFSDLLTLDTLTAKNITFENNSFKGCAIKIESSGKAILEDILVKNISSQNFFCFNVQAVPLSIDLQNIKVSESFISILFELSSLSSNLKCLIKNSSFQSLYSSSNKNDFTQIFSVSNSILELSNITGANVGIMIRASLGSELILRDSEISIKSPQIFILTTKVSFLCENSKFIENLGQIFSVTESTLVLKNLTFFNNKGTLFSASTFGQVFVENVFIEFFIGQVILLTINAFTSLETVKVLGVEGSVITATTSCEFLIKNSSFSEIHGSIIVSLSTSPFNITDSVFKSIEGNVIYSSSSGYFTVNNSIFERIQGSVMTSASYSSGIVKHSNFSQISGTIFSFTLNSDLSIFKCLFQNNTSLLVDISLNSFLSAEEILISRNKYEGYSGAFINIDPNNKNLKNSFKKVKFLDNLSVTSDHFRITNSLVFFEDCEFSRNFLGSRSTFFVLESEIFFNNSFFSSQESTESGTIFRAIFSSSVFIEKSNFSDLISKEGGVGFISDGLLKVSSSKFWKNQAKMWGGCFKIENSEVRIEDSEFEESDAMNGTEIFSSFSNLSLSGCLIKGASSDSEVFSSSIFQDEGFEGRFSRVLFKDSLGNVSFLYSFNVRSTFIENVKISNVSTYRGGSIVMEGDKVFGNSVVNQSSFQDIQCFGYGAAVFSSNRFLKVYHSNFTRNFALVNAGSIFFQSPLCKNCSFFIYGKSFFEENKALGQGGAVFWKDFKPEIESSVVIRNNSAMFGQDFASNPAYLGLKSRKVLEGDENGIRVLAAPGQIFKDEIKIGIFDSYGVLIINDNSSTLKIDVKNKFSDFTLSGQTSFTSFEGIVTISNFTPKGTPGKIYSLNIFSLNIDFSKASNDQNTYNTTLEIEIALRNCKNGESKSESSCIPCPKNYYLIEPASKCKSCPTGGICPGEDKIYIKPDYYRTSSLSEVIYPCDSPGICLGNEEGFNTSCLLGYTGIKCAVCEKGYKKVGISKCFKCSSHSSNVAVIFLTLLAFFVFFVIFIKMTLKSAYYIKSKHSIYIRILTNYLQLIVLVYKFDFNWPDTLENYFQVQESAAVGVSSLVSFECLMFENGISDHESIYYFHLLFYFLFPVIIIVTCLGSWIVISFFEENYQFLKRELFLSMILVFFFFYPAIVRRTFEIYDCEYFDDLGYFLTSDYSIKCFTEVYHSNALKLGLPSVVIWVFGAPFLILLLMIKFRKRLKRSSMMLIFSPLYNGYRSDIFYWEFVVIYRKLMLIVILVFIDKKALLIKGLTLVLILIVSFFLQYYFKPYHSKELNLIESYFLFTVFLTSFLGQYFLYENLETTAKVIISVFIVGINLILFLFWVFWMSRLTLERIVESLEILKKFKKGDSFNEEFYVDHLTKDGVVAGESLEKDSYTFFRKLQTDDEENKGFEIQNMRELYELVSDAE